MAQKQSDDCVVAVTIEMGHHANFRKEPSAEGFTHDWTVFVRGYEGSRLENFVEKVVFKLHNTFKNPVRGRPSLKWVPGYVLGSKDGRRDVDHITHSVPIEYILKNMSLSLICPIRLNVKNEPPFRVTESGYAGFTLPIEIHFKNKQTPRKIIFSYNLFLNAMDRPPVININCEKLKFKNPTPEFKALLIKAGGIELSSEDSSDLLGFVRSQNKALPSIAKDKENDKETVKKKKKKNKSKQQFKSTSLTPSLSSLSPTSSDNEDSYTAPPPPPPVRKENELSVKKESSSSSQPNQDSSSSHRDKSKHRSTSSTSSHKERLDKDVSHKSHKHRDKTKERDRNSSQRDTDFVKKDRDANSQKVVKENLESRKEREGSHSSGKSTTSPSQLDNKIAVHVSHKEREKSLPSKDKDTLGSSKGKLHSSSKDREKLAKEKISPHKDVSPASLSEPKKVAEDLGKEKASKETDRHHKSHKRHVESAGKKVEFKRSSSVASTDEKSLEAESSSKKEKHLSRDNREKELSQEIEESKSLSSDKRIHKKNSHSKKQMQHHSSETEEKKSTEKLSEIPQKLENPIHSDGLAMTATFQPQLLSPFKSKSDQEESLTQQNDLKSILNKQSEQSTSSQKTVSNESVVEKQQKKVEHGHSKYGAKKFRKAKKKSITKHTDVQQCYGLDTLAPNGMSIGELIAVNEQIAKAHKDSNRKLLEKVIRIIGETDDFDIGDVSLSFDICSVDKAVVQQIQALFRER